MEDANLALTANQRTDRAIDVLREFWSTVETQEPQITDYSTGVMINHAKQLVREAS